MRLKGIRSKKYFKRPTKSSTLPFGLFTFAAYFKTNQKLFNNQQNLLQDMKKNLFFVLALALCAMISLPSCGVDDPCKGVECGTNGTCVDGTCACNEGYEGANCEIEASAKFIGDWIGKDICDHFENGVVTRKDTFYINSTTPCTVSKVSESEVKITSLGGITIDQQNVKPLVFNATVSRATAGSATADVVTFDFTEAATSFTQYHIVGSGKIENGAFSGSYTLSSAVSPSEKDECTFSYTK